MASHLKMSLDRVKMETSASQLILWMEYLKYDVNAFDKYCQYMAQIAMEVRGLTSKGKRLALKDFLIPFKFKEKEEVAKVTMDDKLKLMRIKQFFFGLTGLSKAGKKKKGK